MPWMRLDHLLPSRNRCEMSFGAIDCRVCRRSMLPTRHLFDLLLKLLLSIWRKQQIPESKETLALLRLSQRVMESREVADDCSLGDSRLCLSSAISRATRLKSLHLPEVTQQLACGSEDLGVTLVDLTGRKDVTAPVARIRSISARIELASLSRRRIRSSGSADAYFKISSVGEDAFQS